MREPNARVRPREKFELSLDGRQVASIVVGALVLLGVVFVLGLNVGKQIALRQSERPPVGDLDALDRAPAPPAPVKDESLTFHDRLTKEPPNAPPPPAIPTPAVVPAPAAPAPATPSAPPAPPATSAAPPPAPPPPARAAAGPAKPWTVQLAAAQERAEADRIAAKFAALNPRVEEADVPGKGRFWRVRVGGFDTKEAAERYLRDVARETGAKGFVTPSR
jgi:cell division septation protein DedD